MDSYTGGVFFSDGEFISDSILYRGKPPSLEKHIETLSGVYIYGGCLFAHFGHFIWESLSRLYTIRRCKNYPILFISPNEKIYNIQKLFFESIGIENEILLVKYPTLIENLIYSSPGSSISPLLITDEQNESLKYYPFNEKNCKKIWLSRSKLKAGKIINEDFIEIELEKIGFDIVYPETLPLREQARLVSCSDIVAGFDGSQFFSVLFAKMIRAKYFIFNRRERMPKTVSYIFEKRNADFSIQTFDLEYIEGEGPSSNYYHPAPCKIVDILK